MKSIVLGSVPVQGGMELVLFGAGASQGMHRQAIRMQDLDNGFMEVVLD